MTWYHGGPPREGRWLLPPAVTGALSGTDIYRAVFGTSPHDDGVEADRARADRVYLTRARQLARAHAAMIEGTGRGPYGVLYECWPVTLEPDPDQEEDFPGVCIQEPFAMIARVLEAPVRMGFAQMQAALMRYTTPLPGFTKAELAAAGDEMVARLVAGEDVRPSWGQAPK